MLYGLKKAGDPKGGWEDNPHLRLQTQNVNPFGKMVAFDCFSAVGVVLKMLLYFSERGLLSRVCDSHSQAQDRGLGTGE